MSDKTLGQERANELFAEVLDAVHFSVEYSEIANGYVVLDKETNEYRGDDNVFVVDEEAVENDAVTVCHTAKDVLETLDAYICDSFIDDITDELENYGLMKQEDVPHTIGDIVAIVQEWESASEDSIEGRFYRDHAEEIAMMDLIANHISEVDLDTLYRSDKENEVMHFRVQMTQAKSVKEQGVMNISEAPSNLLWSSVDEFVHDLANGDESRADLLVDFVDKLGNLYGGGQLPEAVAEAIEAALDKFGTGQKDVLKEILHFLSDADKIRDFKELTKEESLQSYSYLTEKEYDATAREVAQRNADFYDKYTDELAPPTVDLVLEEMEKDGVPATLVLYVEDVANYLDTFNFELSKEKSKKKADIERG